MAEALKRADIRYFVGATGSGKGVGIRQHLAAAKPARLVIFDPLHEYGDIATPVQTAGEAIRAMQRARFAVAWQPKDGTDYEGATFKRQFELLCRAAFTAGDMWLLVEELELVTRPSWGPPQWRNCTKRGRHQGLHILAASQRPADCDKAFLASCTYIRCHSLREHEDRQRMARAMDVPIEEVNSLKTIIKSAKSTEITFYEVDYNEATRGKKTVTMTRK